MAVNLNLGPADDVKPASYLPSRWSPLLRRLSEEIDILRKEMEQTYDKGCDFQSEKLIAMSQKLDLKINEFLYHQLG